MAPEYETVAVLGIGTMGHGMAASVLRAGLPTIVWNRDPEPTRDLADLGADVAETAATLPRALRYLYQTEAAGDQRMRLLGFERVELQPGDSRTVTVTADPRLLARYDGDATQWHITEGTHRIALGKASDDLVLTDEAPLTGRLFGS